MQLAECLKIIGNGRSTAGLAIVERLAFYLVVARYKHPIEARNLNAAFKAIVGECDELGLSIAADDSDVLSSHTIDEAYDVLVTAARLINREYTCVSK